MTEQEQMPFAPDSSRGHDQNARNTNTTQVIPGQQCRGGERDFLVISDGDGVRGQYGSEGGAEDGHER